MVATIPNLTCFYTTSNLRPFSLKSEHFSILTPVWPKKLTTPPSFDVSAYNSRTVCRR